jgi:hypothetical protein
MSCLGSLERCTRIGERAIVSGLIRAFATNWTNFGTSGATERAERGIEAATDDACELVAPAERSALGDTAGDRAQDAGIRWRLIQCKASRQSTGLSLID